MNIDITRPGSHNFSNGAATLCSYVCTMAPPIASICLSDVLSMGGENFIYFHDVAGNQACRSSSNSIKTVTSDFPVFYFFC